MNAAARALAEGAFDMHNVFAMIFSKRMVALMLLVIMVLTTAFAVVSVKNLNRHLVTELTFLEKTRDAMHVQWGQLLLEQNTWAAQARTQHIAQEQLSMAIPAAQNVVMIKAQR